MKYYISNSFLFLGGGGKMFNHPSAALHYKYNELSSLSGKAKNEMVPVRVFNTKTQRDYALITPPKFLGNDGNIVSDIKAAKSFSSVDEASEYVINNNVTRLIDNVKIIDSTFKQHNVNPCPHTTYSIMMIEDTQQVEDLPDPPQDDSERKYPRIQFSKDVRGRVYSKDRGICGICGKPVNRYEFTIDHIIPLAKGGSNDEDNLQVAHEFCNKVKGSYTENEYITHSADMITKSLLENPNIDLINKLARSIVRGINRQCLVAGGGA